MSLISSDIRLPQQSRGIGRFERIESKSGIAIHSIDSGLATKRKYHSPDADSMDAKEMQWDAGYGLAGDAFGMKSPMALERPGPSSIITAWPASGSVIK